MPRCFGAGDGALASYHDAEWGQPASNPTAVRRGTRSGLHEDELYEALASGKGGPVLAVHEKPLGFG